MKKNNKKIINEINRLNELMGLNKKLLNEQAWIDDLITGLIQAGAKQGDEITTLATKLSDDALTTLEKTDVLEDIIRIAQREGNDDLLRVVNTQLVRSGGRLMSQLDDIIVNNRSVIQAGIDRGASKSDLQKMFVDDFNPNTGDDILDELIKRQLRTKIGKEYDELISTTDDITSTTTRVTDDAAETGARETGDDAAETGTRELSGEEVENLINDLEDIPWDNVPLISEEVANHMLTTANRGTFGRWVRGDFRRLYALLVEKTERIRKLSKLYIETTNSTLKARLEERIKADLYDLALNNKKLLNETNSELTDVINSFGRERGNIINPNEKRFAEYIGDLRKETDGFKVVKIMNLTSEGRKGLTILGDAFRASIPGKTKWINTVINIGKSVKEIPARLIGKEGEAAAKETIEKIASDRQKTWNWVKSGSPRGNPWRTENQKNYIKIIEKGGLSAAKKSYILELIFRLIQWKVLFAVIYTFRNAITSSIFTSSEKKSRMKNCILLRNSSDATQEQINSACSEFNDVFSKWAMDSIEGNLDENDEEGKRFIKDLIDQIFSDFFDEASDLFPGKIDDMVYFVYKTIIFFSNDKQQEQLENALRDGQQTAQDQIETTTQEIENALEEEGISVNDESSDNNAPQPGSIEDVASKLGVPTNQVTQDGDIFIWTFNGQEMGRYKLINGELERQ